MIKIIEKKWNDDLVGFECLLNNNKKIQVQFEIESNRLHGGYGLHYPILDQQNEYGLNLTSDEHDQVIKLIKNDPDFLSMSNVLDNFSELSKK